MDKYGGIFVVVVALFCVSVIGIVYVGDNNREEYEMAERAVLPEFGSTANTFNVGTFTFTVLTDPSESVNGTVSVVRNNTTPLTGAIVIPPYIQKNRTGPYYDVVRIDNSGFSDCSGLTSVTIPDSVTSIGRSAFYSCAGLTTVNMSKNIISIDNNAFLGCTRLTSVTIPDSVTSIGIEAFKNCIRLKEIAVDGGNSHYTSDEGVLYNNEKTTLIVVPGGKTGSFSVPDSVTSIANDAFWRCTGLTSITIPNSITSIGNGVFESCTGLTSITIPNSVTSIGTAFYHCNALTTVTVTGKDPLSGTSLLDSNFRTSWILPGQESVSIQTLEIDTEEIITLSNVEPINDKKIIIFPGTKNTVVGDLKFYDVSGEITNSLKRVGLVYTGNNTSFIATGACITFDSNGGNPTPRMQIIDFDNPISDPGLVIKTGYNFIGWYDADDVEWDTTAPDVKRYTQLEARWAGITYVVTFNANGGSTSTASIMVTYGETYGELPTSTKSGYTFKGWFTELSGGRQVQLTTTVDNASNHTLYAHWVVVQQQHHNNNNPNINRVGETIDENLAFILSIFILVILLVAIAIMIDRH